MAKKRSGKPTNDTAPPQVGEVPVPWRTVLVSCRKCSRKLDGGFGPDGGDTLAQALKLLLRARGQRRSVRLVETGCLGICPKGAVVVLNQDTPGRVLVVPRGTAPDHLAERLLPADRLTPSEATGS